MSLYTEWRDFCLATAAMPEHCKAADRRIYSRLTWTIDAPLLLQDESVRLDNIGYTGLKMSLLRRHYTHEESLARAAGDLNDRVRTRKYGSGAFIFRGEEKKTTKQDFCIQSCVISYYPNTKTTDITIFYRTVDLIQKFRADLLFFRDHILPRFDDSFNIAEPKTLQFVFANATFAPMFVPFLFIGYKPWKEWMEKVRKTNPGLYRDLILWSECYFSERHNKFKTVERSKMKFHKMAKRSFKEEFQDYITEEYRKIRP